MSPKLSAFDRCLRQMPVEDRRRALLVVLRLIRESKGYHKGRKHHKNMTVDWKTAVRAWRKAQMEKGQ